MKEILVLGCSYSEGQELIDAELSDKTLVNDYWDFLNYRRKEWLSTLTFKDREKWSQSMYKRSGNALNYFNRCHNLAWPKLLEDATNLKVNNYSISGGGIGAYQYLFNEKKNTK